MEALNKIILSTIGLEIFMHYIDDMITSIYGRKMNHITFMIISVSISIVVVLSN